MIVSSVQCCPSAHLKVHWHLCDDDAVCPLGCCFKLPLLCMFLALLNAHIHKKATEKKNQYKLMLWDISTDISQPVSVIVSGICFMFMSVCVYVLVNVCVCAYVVCAYVVCVQCVCRCLWMCASYILYVSVSHYVECFVFCCLGAMAINLLPQMRLRGSRLVQYRSRTRVEVNHGTR